MESVTGREEMTWGGEVRLSFTPLIALGRYHYRSHDKIIVKELGEISGEEHREQEEARKKAAEFLRETLKLKDVKVVKVAKVSAGWETVLEVYEEELNLDLGPLGNLM